VGFSVEQFTELIKGGMVSWEVWAIFLILGLVGGFIALLMIHLKKEGVIQ